MNIKNIFKYKPQNKYDFNIQTTENAVIQDLNTAKIEKKVCTSLNENLEFLQSKFNSLIKIFLFILFITF